ncbi:conserved hypothetical protein [Leptothrix cholodnii SP-6]|uniref:TIGR02270 family protein n=2 Tax=Leptothrix cholodnii TaxID=34029 RepID=B1XWX5_LEPCP|nr:conserved hypothetical protein [Leptothrix cholodnii SP-6]
MATTLRAFHVGLYEEHLEDLSFLHEQRGALLRKPGQPWQDLAALEARMEEHLDALVVGDTLALDVCRRRAAEGDVGELHAAVCICCRQKQSGLLAVVLRDLDMADPQKAAAVADALIHEMPDDWAPFIGQAIERRDARLTPLLASVTGRRRLPFGPQLVQALRNHGHAAGLERIVDALGLLGEPGVQGLLQACTRSEHPAVRDAALDALLRLGVAPPPLGEPGGDTFPQALRTALAGDRHTARALAAAAQAGRATASDLLALGLLGDPGSLRALHDSLARPELAESAALALHWVSGAPLVQAVFVAEEVNEDALIGNELQAWHRYREAPKRPDGRPYGETVDKLSTEQAQWKQWFSEHAARFDPALRYRSGRPCSPAVLLANLADPQADARLRCAAARELAVRYGCDRPFEADMRVARQCQAIEAIGRWVAGPGAGFEPGQWVFAGRPQ